jgi:16S rRNA (uracil1498-N3)-methyltransferase
LSAPAGFAAECAATALVFVPDVGADDLRIDGDDGHHLQRVRRVAVGESVVAADGTGRWAPCTVAEVAPGSLRLTRAAPVRAEPELTPRLAVAFAPAKGDHAADVVHALVELGVDRIVPIETERSVVRWRGERGARAVARLRRVAREAAAMAHRASVPVVEECAPLATVAEHPGVVLGDRAGGPESALGAPVGGEWLVVTGPEGGFSAGERDLLAHAGRLAVGPHVLRARTAPVALAAVLGGRRSIGDPRP